MLIYTSITQLKRRSRWPVLQTRITLDALPSPQTQGGEIKLLSQGAANTDYNGSLTFGANYLNAGDIIRIIAWGEWYNSHVSTGGTVGIRLYFEDVDPPTLIIADANTSALAPNLGNYQEWWLHAFITLRTADTQNPNAYCNCFVECVENPAGFNKSMGRVAFTLDRTVAQYVDLSAQVTTQGSFTLQQCSIEVIKTA